MMKVIKYDLKKILTLAYSLKYVTVHFRVNTENKNEYKHNGSFTTYKVNKITLLEESYLSDDFILEEMVRREVINIPCYHLDDGSILYKSYSDNCRYLEQGGNKYEVF